MAAADRRSLRPLVALQLAAAALTALTGAGYDLSPGAPTTHPLTAPWSSALTTTATMLALAAAGTMAAAAAWLLLHPERLALVVSTFLVTALGVANVAALWVYARADPPLPPSWDWLRAMHLLGTFLAVAWGSVALAARPRLGAGGRE